MILALPGAAGRELPLVKRDGAIELAMTLEGQGESCSR